jgi:2-polyprenyl-3-methyl-5-hydroxy-6-metoxy-1,4-benzoquinol methylase
MVVYNSPKKTRNVKVKWNKIYNKQRNRNLVLVMRIPDDPIVSTALSIKKHHTKQLTYLDIGCGDGFYAVQLTKKGFNSTGIDISEAAIRRARQFAKKNNVHVNFIAGNSLRKKIKGQFDLVASNFVLQFVKESYKRKFIENMMSHTAPHGYNVIVFHTKHRPRVNSKTGMGEDIEGFQKKLVDFYVKKGWSVKKHKTGFSGKNYVGFPVYWEYIVAQNR